MSDLNLNQEHTANLADSINCISRFLAAVHMPSRSVEQLGQSTCDDKVDLLILLGNSIPYVAEIAAKAYRLGVAKEFMIVGGIGHSTSYLKEHLARHALYRNISMEGKTEAELLLEVAVIREGLDSQRILLETESTNCGANASNAFALLRKLGKKPRSILLFQDPTMQLRTDASFRKVWNQAGEEALFINCAAFVPQVVMAGGRLEYRIQQVTAASSLWSMERFLSLIMGEIPRLYDDEHGYGPLGRGYIGHVDVPGEVMLAYRSLLPSYGTLVRSPWKGASS